MKENRMSNEAKNRMGKSDREFVKKVIDPMVEEAIGAIVEKLAKKLATLESVQKQGSVVRGSFSVSVGDKHVLSLTMAEHLDNANGSPFYDKPEVVHALLAAQTDEARAALMSEMTSEDKTRVLLMVRMYGGNAGNIAEIIRQGRSGRKSGHKKAAAAA
jgi:hypothetical protein